MNVKIQAIHFDADQKLIEMIEEKIQRITHFYDQPMTTTVYLKLDRGNDHIHQKVVEIKVLATGKVIYAEEKSNSFESSFEVALDHVVKQVKRHKEKLHG